MYNSYLEHSEWSIIESGFKKENHMSSESIFSLGNGIFGQRGNFEEALEYMGLEAGTRIENIRLDCVFQY